MLEHVAVGVGDLAHHIGPHQVAAVDHGGGGGDELQGGDLEALAEGGHRQVHVGKFIPAPDHAGGLTLHIDAGGLQETEVLQVIVELLRPQPLANLNEGRVTGVGHRFGQILVAMAVPVGAADGVAGPPLHLGHAGTEEVVAFADHALLQGGGQHHGLEGGTGLIGAGYRLVGPLAVKDILLRILDGLVVGLLGGSALRQGLRIGLLLGVSAALDVLQVLKEHRVADGPGIVQIEGGRVGPAQDGPGVGVHHQAERTVLHVELLHTLLQDALTVRLDGSVDGKGQIVSVRSVIVVFKAVEQLGAHAVLGGDHPAGLAGQFLLKLGLQAVGAHIVGVGIDPAHHMGRQAALGVISFAGGHQVDAMGQVVFGDKCLDRLRLLRLHPIFDDLILGVLVLQVAHHVLDFQIQKGRQILRHKLVGGLRVIGQRASVLLGVLHLLTIGLLRLHEVLRGELHVVYRGAHGQHRPLAVIDGAPVGGNGAVSGLLLHRQFLVVVMLADLDLPQLEEQGNKHHQTKQRHEKQAADQNGTVGPPVRPLPDDSSAFLSFFCHFRLTSLGIILHLYAASRLEIP